ncbi:MAG: MBOAT family O-acyltransferase [Myxococcota bacterium]|nr:MBOAT family O-acyltransferase [Myxococcota bacterium]
MLFNSIAFFVFLAIVYAAYRALPRRGQNRWLLAASYFFYGAWDWRFLGLILLSTVIDYGIGLGLQKSRDPRRRKLLVTISVVANLTLLGVFKYAGFFTESLADLVGLFGFELSPFTRTVVLPVGISFYTFQTLSYTIDVYRGRLEPTRDFLDFALFVAFFPQLVAGPIERAVNLLPQIQRERTVTWEKVNSGSWLIFWGIFKKAVIADHCLPLTHAVFAPGATPTGPEVLLASYAFGLYAYCDFSGYSDIARGTARLLGFELMLNFNLPYYAESLRDFWRRWHISLSSWLRDYLYIPLGGNRRRRYFNLWITMVLCGLWHGAGWNYVMFGVYHGSILCLLAATTALRERLFGFRSPAARRLWQVASVVITFHVVTLSWPIFEAGTLRRSGELLHILFTNFEPGLAPQWIPTFLLLCTPMFLIQAVQLGTGDLEPLHRFRVPVRAAVYFVLMVAIVLLGEDFGDDFFYFQF